VNLPFLQIRQKMEGAFSNLELKEPLEINSKIKEERLSSKKILAVWKTDSKNINPPRRNGAIRFVCLSDTHTKHQALVNRIPEGDVLIHTGDFTLRGHSQEVHSFNDFLRDLPHKYKVVIAGNHDVTFHPEYYLKKGKRFHTTLQDHVAVKKSLSSCIYLEDSEVTVEGIRIYGSPWQPEFCDWAFNLERGPEIKKKWDLIPKGIDVLMTHGPPHGKHGGIVVSGLDAGCEELAIAIKRIQPPVHVFGHIHEGYGITNDDKTTYINASSCTFHYKPSNEPIVFDIM